MDPEALNLIKTFKKQLKERKKTKGNSPPLRKTKKKDSVIIAAPYTQSTDFSDLRLW